MKYTKEFNTVLPTKKIGKKSFDKVGPTLFLRFGGFGPFLFPYHLDKMVKLPIFLGRNHPHFEIFEHKSQFFHYIFRLKKKSLNMGHQSFYS